MWSRFMCLTMLNDRGKFKVYGRSWQGPRLRVNIINALLAGETYTRAV